MTPVERHIIGQLIGSIGVELAEARIAFSGIYGELEELKAGKGKKAGSHLHSVPPSTTDTTEPPPAT